MTHPEAVKRTVALCEREQTTYEALRDKYSPGSNSWHSNDGKATIWRQLKENAKCGEPDLLIPHEETTN